MSYVPPVGTANATNLGLIRTTGDLGGTGSAPVVAKIKGVTLPVSAPSAGQVLTADTAASTAWTTPVNSVNTKTGSVTLGATDVGAVPLESGGQAMRIVGYGNTLPATGQPGDVYFLKAT